MEVPSSQPSLTGEQVALAIAAILAKKVDAPNPLPVIAILLAGLLPPSIHEPLRSRLSHDIATLVLKDQPKARGKGAAEIAALEKEYSYRAHYALVAMDRLARTPENPEEIAKTLATEERYFQAHQQAQGSRMKGARLNDAAAEIYGDELGWHHGPLTPNDRENHVAAHGHNYRVSSPPVSTQGLPATLSNCKCVPGPPRAGAPMLT